VTSTQSQLATMAQEIVSRYSGIHTTALAMAFARNESAGYERLTALVKDLHIAILINNVGKSHDIPIPFLETTEGEMGSVPNLPGPLGFGKARPALSKFSQI